MINDQPHPMVSESTLHDESAARLAVLSNESAMLAAEVSKLSARLAALKRTLHTAASVGGATTPKTKTEFLAAPETTKKKAKNNKSMKHSKENAPNSKALPTKGLKFIDIGANLTDSMFQGVYHGKEKHSPDYNQMLERSWDAGLDAIVITGGSLSDCKSALQLASTDERLFCTVGCHPTRCLEFNTAGASAYYDALALLVASGGSNVVAIGECGLDYARLEFCPKEVQLEFFKRQLGLSAMYNLPLFLHCRDAGDDLINILRDNQGSIKAGGVVHSFDGPWEVAEELLALDLYIGINGCSLKTNENLDVAKRIPANRLLIETDAPWCEIRPTHAGFKFVKTKPETRKKEKFETGFVVKGRNEPLLIQQVLEVLAAIRNEPEVSLAHQIYENTRVLFRLNMPNKRPVSPPASGTHETWQYSSPNVLEKRASPKKPKSPTKMIYHGSPERPKSRKTIL